MGLVSLFKKHFRTIFFTTPSHSGRFFITSKFRQFYKYDISETDTYNPQAELQKSEEKAAKIYNVKSTKFLLNGSTSGIIISVLASCKSGDNVLIWDNAHKCHKNAVELAGANPIYYELEKNEEWGIYKELTTENLEDKLRNNDVKAVIVTSPSYYGVLSDIKSLKNVCKKYGALLIVDEAHGALYPFCNELPNSSVGISDFTVQSLHKTAGGLNSTALLHSTFDKQKIEKAFEKVSTTSPSYAMLMSIERNIAYLNSWHGRDYIKTLIERIKTLKLNLPMYDFYDGDITKIVVKKQGMTGFELSKRLFENGIEDEITNEKSTMLLCGIGTDLKKIQRLEKVLKKISKEK